jgi:UDPglucose 6-dehydrogenase
MEEAARLLTDVEMCKGPYECVKGADVVAIVTEWDQFRALDLQRVKAAVKSPNVVDLRNIYRPEEMRERGFNYVSIGRP